MLFKKHKKRYYREWLSSWGWGVMMAYDTVMAYSKRQASEMNEKLSMYAYDRSFETVVKVKKEHLHMTNEQLSKIYGSPED